MDKRFLMVGGGLIAAIAVVTLAILVGGPSQSKPAGPKPTPPTLVNPGISAEDLNNPPVGIQDPVEVIREFEIYREDGDSVTVFTGEQVVPQPNFVSDVVRPTAEIHSSNNRVIRITADAGRFYHPGNEPTRGEFHQHTVVTQFQAPDGERLDLTTDQHVQFRLYLDELTRFDRENGQIQSDGPVRLVGPTIDFTGQGLDLTFNLLDQRVERLVIAQGDELRLAQNSTFTQPGSPTPKPRAAEQSDKAPDTTPSSPNQTPTTTAQPYRVVLHDNLDINVGPDNTTLTGDRLEVLFTLAPDADDNPNNQPSAANAHPTPPTPKPRAAERSDKAPDHPQTTYYISTTPTPQPRALLTPSPDDIVVKWTGQLELKPIHPNPTNQPPKPRAAEQSDKAPDPDSPPAPDQAVLTLHGTPAVLNNPAEDQHITAAFVGYRTDGKTVFAHSSDSHALTISSPELGNLQATALTLSDTEGAGQILGPGQLNADEQGLRVSFTDRLELDFHRDADDALSDLKSATFHGNVNAVAESDDPDQQLDLTSQSLALTLTPDAEGKVQPSHLQALGNAQQPVLAKQPNTTFQANSLDVDLAPKPRAAEQSDKAPDTDTDQIQITRLRALGNITVQLIEEQTTLTAHALDADPNRGRLELFGENDQTFATLTRDGATLAGVHLILEENAQTADALGPGTFSADVDEDDPTAKLNIAWTQSMNFDNTQGKAKFVGNVRSASTSATDDTSLDAHTLALEFVPQDFTNENDPNPSNADSPKPRAEDRSDKAPDQTTPAALDLRRAHAIADPDNDDQQVNFTAQTFAEDQPQADKPLTRVTLIGRELIFINQPPNLTNQTTIDDNITIEQVIVPTRGRMLLEDYRTAEKPRAAERIDKAPDTPSASPINFAGRGVTLFAWEDQLTLDAQANDLRLEQDVFMLHRPDDGSEAIKLDAQRLVADLTETGGLGAYLSQDNSAPQAQIRKVNADGRVRVAQGPSNVVADHLEYEESKRTVLLWAEPRREVVLNRDDQPNGRTTARALRWDLDNDLFTAIDPGTGVVPVE
ncbi:hypothetical protein [Algisphaera agarilytica]|uniref:Uncharacterized protein n=1 Tax=Algisphaera agarilytica TaxID=1385975 RepID=A0A7X0H529_9BACT|nr:hypothetical protein [Algisphaera agarilytica]MBB6429394.1 hypothetical protein [Algisphaera agarilytica]